MNPPLLAIQCITYNHEPYIRQCLEGIVMQRTNFPFVAIVHDDASTDNTADIIREYVEKYPEIIIPIYEQENQFSKRDGSLWRILGKVINDTKSKYVAFCEGDDYWIDPLKLQKQVEFLETNPEYVLCYHNRLVQKNFEEVYNDLFKPMKVDLGKNEAMYHKIPTLTVVYRNCIPVEESNKIYLDILFWLYLSVKGKFHYMDFYGAVYRIHEGGICSGCSTLVNCTRSINARIFAFKNFKGIDKQGLALVINDWLKERVKACLYEKNHWMLVVQDVCRFVCFYLYAKVVSPIIKLFNK